MILMFSLRRKVFVVLCFLSLLVILCMWYSESSVTKLSIVTTVHSSYIYTADALRATNKTKSDINDNLNELRQLKNNLETLIEKYSSSNTHVDNNKIDGVSELSTAPLDSLPSDITDLRLSVHRKSDKKVVNVSQNKHQVLGSKWFTTEVVETNKTHTVENTVVPVDGTLSSMHVVSNDKEQHQSRNSEYLLRERSDIDRLVKPFLLQALMNRTSDKQPRLLSQEQQIEARTKPGCKSTGNFPTEESKDVWLTFNSTLERYATFHREQLKLLKAGNSSVRTLTWSCQNPVRCAGVGDQFYRIQEALVFAIAFKRVLTLHWNHASYETMRYLQPNKIDWTYFNKSQGMHELHDAEIGKIKVIDTGQKFELLYNLLADGGNHTHMTVNFELQVPFLKGMSLAIRTNPGMREALKEIGFAALLTEKKKRLPINFLSGELLRYLFYFKGYLVDKVDQVQKQFEINDKPYLAVHIRTGFLGMEQEESGKFNSEKIYRNSDDWERTLACSVSLADKLQFGSETPIFLATDSSKVKALAEDKYSKRFAMINATLQHVAFSSRNDQKSDTSLFEGTKIKNLHTTIIDSVSTQTKGGEPILNDNGVDGYMATWLEFLLLARASAMVHSISGFSSVASEYCSMHNQYHVPQCNRL